MQTDIVYTFDTVMNILKQIELVNFKNVTSLGVSLSDGINCFIGPNGAGKTNILDAIHYLSFCKSYFNTIDSYSIRDEEDFFVIQAEFELDGDINKFYCGVKRGQKKQFRRNKSEYEKLSDHIGIIPLVMISPVDSKLILGGSDERRRYIDGVISQFDRVYLENLISYNRILLHRNTLLKKLAETRSRDFSLLDIIDKQIAEFALPVYKKRVEFLQKLIPEFNYYYEVVSGKEENVSVEYTSSLHDSGFEEKLKSTREKDVLLGFTSAGIHKDDLEFLLKGSPLKRMGSQGQQKSFLIALKLAQFNAIKRFSGKTPLLLLDDIFDKLDTQRVENIVSMVVQNGFGQIFMTDTNRDHLDSILTRKAVNYKIFEVLEGNVTEKNTT